MEQRQHQSNKEVVARLQGLTAALPPGELADALYMAVVGALNAGYSRDAMYEDLAHLARIVRDRGEQEKEDDIVDVSNVLVGYCAPSARI